MTWPRTLPPPAPRRPAASSSRTAKLKGDASLRNLDRIVPALATNYANEQARGMGLKGLPRITRGHSEPLIRRQVEGDAQRQRGAIRSHAAPPHPRAEYPPDSNG